MLCRTLVGPCRPSKWCFYSFLGQLSWSVWSWPAHCRILRRNRRVLQIAGRTRRRLRSWPVWVSPTARTWCTHPHPSRTFPWDSFWNLRRWGITAPRLGSSLWVWHIVPTISLHRQRVERRRRWLCGGGGSGSACWITRSAVCTLGRIGRCRSNLLWSCWLLSRFSAWSRHRGW